MAFERSQLKILQRRLGEPRRFIQVVQGPRQVGDRPHQPRRSWPRARRIEAATGRGPRRLGRRP